MYSTYYFLIAGFISFLVVFIVCKPLNKLRTFMTVTVTILFYIILFVMYDFFDIYCFFDLRIVWVIPICISSIFVINVLKELISYLYKVYESH